MSVFEENGEEAPIVKEPVIDHLTFLVPWGVGPQWLKKHRSFDKVEERVAQAKEEGLCQMWRASGRYRLHARIELPGRSKVLIGLGARDSSQKGGIRIECNPAKFAPGDAAHLHGFVRGAVGSSYDTYLVDAIVNRMDIAVDAMHVALKDLLVDYHGAHEATVFGTRLKKGGRIETLNFGSVSSDFRTTVYSKSKERVDKAIKNLLKEHQGADKLKYNLVRQVHQARELPPTIRVEVRGMKIRKPVYELLAAGNRRFERFCISELAGLNQLDPFTRDCFVALVRSSGLRAALETYQGKPEYAQLAAIVACPAPWWKPEGLWARGIKALKASGLFPKEAFKEPGER